MCDPRLQQQPHQPSLRQVALAPAIHPIAVLPDDPVAVPLEQAALTVGAERLGRVAGEGGRLVVIVQVVSSHLSAPFTLGRSWSAPHCRVTPSAFNWLLPYRAVPTAPPAATRTRYSSSRAPRRREAGTAAHKPRGKPGGDTPPTDRQGGCGRVRGARHVCEWCNGWRRGRFAGCNATSHGASPLPPVPSILGQTRPAPALAGDPGLSLSAGAGLRLTHDWGDGAKFFSPCD